MTAATKSHVEALCLWMQLLYWPFVLVILAARLCSSSWPQTQIVRNSNLESNTSGESAKTQIMIRFDHVRKRMARVRIEKDFRFLK